MGKDWQAAGIMASDEEVNLTEDEWPYDFFLEATEYPERELYREVVRWLLQHCPDDTRWGAVGSRRNVTVFIRDADIAMLFKLTWVNA